MRKPVLVAQCPRPAVVCRACDAVFLRCVCGMQHTVTYLDQCRLCTPAVKEETHAHP